MNSLMEMRISLRPSRVWELIAPAGRLRRWTPTPPCRRSPTGPRSRTCSCASRSRSTGAAGTASMRCSPRRPPDYRSAGGIEGPYPEVKDWLAAVLPMFRVTQHLVLNSHVELAGDEGRGTTAFHNPNEATIDGEPWIFTVGGTYHDR